MTNPHCDILTGKIYGCEEGSWVWYHEKGHIEFNNQERTSRLKLYQEYLFWLWMFTVTLSTINKYMLALALPSMLIYLFLFIYEEFWCNKYANKHYNDYKSKDEEDWKEVFN